MKSVYVALGVNFEGKKEVLGLWIAETEGAKFWMGVLTELKNRGLQDILIACMDGLSGFPDAVRAVYPQTRVQLCHGAQLDEVRLVQGLEKSVRRPEGDLLCRHRGGRPGSAFGVRREMGRKVPHDFPVVGAPLGRPQRVLQVPSGDSPRPMNAVESLNYQLRKVTKNRSTFCTDDAILKILYLAIRNASKKWTMPVREWRQALNQFAIEFGKERVPF